MSETIVVMGANGTVGRRVARSLLEQDYRVRIPVGDRHAAAGLEAVGAEVMTGNLMRGNPTAWFRGADAAFLMVPLHPRMEEAGLRLNRAVRQQGVRRVVRLSILGDLMEAGVSFARSHERLDEDLFEAVPSSAVLRPDGFMQNLLGSAASIRAGHLINAAGRGRSAFIDADDIAACAVAMLTGQYPCRGRHDLTGPEPLSYREITRLLSRQLGWPVAYVDLPVSQYRLMLQELGVPMHMVGVLGELAEFIRSGEGGRVSTKVGEILRRPAGSMEAFIDANQRAFVTGTVPDGAA